MQSLLQIKNLSKNYITKNKVTKAVDNISLDINDNEFITLIGPSGCGKSTILSIIGNLDEKSSGIIKFKNKDIKVGYMFQEDLLFPWLTVYENTVLGLKIKKELNEENKKYVNDLLKKYGLIEFKNNYPKELSGGMRQRVALIRTLALKPDILLLDEPFSALDYHTRIEISDDVYKIIKKEGKTAIMVTHDIQEAIAMSDKVIVLSKRPAKIKRIYDIVLENKTVPSKNRNDKNFSNYYEKIWKDFDSDD